MSVGSTPAGALESGGSLLLCGRACRELCEGCNNLEIELESQKDSELSWAWSCKESGVVVSAQISAGPILVHLRHQAPPWVTPPCPPFLCGAIYLYGVTKMSSACWGLYYNSLSF